jgi:hypothetical protein
MGFSNKPEEVHVYIFLADQPRIADANFQHVALTDG